MNKFITYLGVACILFLLGAFVFVLSPSGGRTSVRGNTSLLAPADVQPHARPSAPAPELLGETAGDAGFSSPRGTANPYGRRADRNPHYAPRYGAGTSSAEGSSPVNLDDYRIDLGKLKGSHPYLSNPGAGEYAKSSYKPRAGSYARTGSAGSSGYTGGTHALPGSSARGALQDKASLAREKILNQYGSPATRKLQEKLNKQLSGVSDGIHRAIAQALVPKGKRETNIEKYLARHNGEPVPSSNPFDSVVKQVSDQKAGVVNSMASSFGAAAGKQAGQIMDSFANEMQQAVNTPNATPEEIAAKTKAINDKYQKQLQKFGQKQAANQALQERMAEDQKLKEQLSSKYGSKIGAQLGQVIDEYRQRELALAREPLSVEEYHKRLSQLHIEREEASRNILRQNGVSAAGYNEIQEQQAKERLEQMGRDIESGKKLEQRMTDGDRNYILQDSQQQTDQIARQYEQAYGPEAAQQVRDLQREYEERLRKNMAPNPDGSERSRHEIDVANNQAREEMNQRLQEIGREAGVHKATDEQVGKLMSSLPDNMPAAQRRELESQLRPIYEDMYRTIYSTEDEGARRAAQEQAQRRIQEVVQQMETEQSGAQ